MGHKAKRATRRLSPTGYSSARYGNCECCDKPASDVWIGTPNNGRSHVFGHEACVRLAIGVSA